MSRLLKMGLPLVALVAAGLAFHLWGQGNALAAIVLGIVTGASLAGAAMAVHALLGVAVTCAMGAGVGAYLTLKHHDALSGGAASACNVNETFNCDLINTSQYSEIAGVPIALIGVAFYLALGLTAWLGWRDRHGYDRAPGLVVAGGVAAVGYSAFLAWASTTVGAWCLFCISLYVVNALILAGGLLASKADPAGASVSAALQGKGDRSMATALVAGLALLAVGQLGYSSLGSAAADAVGGVGSGGEATDDQLAQLFEQPGGEVSLSGREPVYGDPNAPYTLVEWADYECPHCARTAVDLKKLAARTPDLKILFRHYPLSPKCNENVGRDMHEHACAAARAAVCAQEQGLFWELNEMMFANQQYLAPDDLSFMAGQVGLDVTALQECMDDPATADAVKRDVDAGNKAGIYSTPSLFLKGVHPDGWIKVSMGPEAIPFLLDAVREGRTLPAARPPTQ